MAGSKDIQWIFFYTVELCKSCDDLHSFLSICTCILVWCAPAYSMDQPNMLHTPSVDHTFNTPTRCTRSAVRSRGARSCGQLSVPHAG